MEIKRDETVSFLDTDAIIDDICKICRAQNESADTELVRRAYALAKEAHKEQKRRSGAPYLEHPVRVAQIVAHMTTDTTAIAAALLHDVVEDTAYSTEYVKANFGQSVSDIVDGVTKLKKLQYNTHEEQQVENLRKMFIAMAKDIRVVIIKLVDRLHNMRTLEYMSVAKQCEKAKETLEIYAPLAHRLGMSKIKAELEDLSLKYIDPVAYQELRDSINQKKREREEFINSIIETLEKKLSELNLKGQVTGRAKHFYSIYKKMYVQNKTLDELYDLFAVRIIVDTVSECYAMLGTVHEIYTPITGRFKDYIATPKPNMYQSLHTTVIGSREDDLDHGGVPVEIQIRTWEMHRIAEEGIAAHWKYKEGVSGPNEMDEKLSWIRQVLETQVETIDTDDFLNNIKLDLFADEVFVFTPNGKVLCLPAKSTPIDFAFSIHSGIGYKMSGAKVNGRIVNNDYILKNGDIVEILTSANIAGPSKDWLKIVRTTQAKNKINQWFKRENRDENIAHGKLAVEKELKRLGYTHSQLFDSDSFGQLLRRYNLNDENDLYASVGYGGLSAQKIVLRLRDDYVKNKKGEEHEFEQAPVTPVRNSSNGIIVEGIENCLVRLSKCCNPIPGDEIKGFITKGRGVSVHRADCCNIREDSLAPEDRDRFINVRWERSGNSSYVALIQIDVYDRRGLIQEISSTIFDMGISCSSINAKVNKKGIATVCLGVEICEKDDVDRIMKRLAMMDGAINVSRTQN
ncbi:MAG: bifunctional (p)ppGpp synthetase/guanosine-3',5'-bis(diphosphate) 3'-pyrophosphohydrolase [Oscillospiraceae bacterium]|nr:bifunctional (p)ppGpp synthetase/guanosine-3',5'-bis(diphosphate) 3'-pyrophosphohydrolase [Oscillospiraceae bacterium]